MASMHSATGCVLHKSRGAIHIDHSGAVLGCIVSWSYLSVFPLFLAPLAAHLDIFYRWG